MQVNLFNTHQPEKIVQPCDQVKPQVIRNYNGYRWQMKIKKVVVIIPSCWVENKELFANIGLAYGSGYNRIETFKHVRINNNIPQFHDFEIERGMNGKEKDRFYYQFINENISEIVKLIKDLSV